MAVGAQILVFPRVLGWMPSCEILRNEETS